ncbi:MAG: 2-polyprenyl-3-methyl-6-methoxy-1,4-benzoquinone monooxygenase [Thiotrichaceae bacterium]|nr:2-polyprenyl-3-methyl-6-methoxy-1,4-benzoquinone monooxygenase [Thiotrichaceae bacterium]
MNQYSTLDYLIINFDQGLRTVFGQPLGTARPNPADKQMDAELSETEKREVVGLMRVNHSGEVSAQALYQGQALTAHSEEVRNNMQQSAWEENDHLIWCQKRVEELGGHTSLLNPLWYVGSFTIGAVAGAVGDKYSLGFVAETEKQVVKHLEEHLERLPQQEQKSQAILEQMKEDEAHHATLAIKSGGVPLPSPVRWMMGKMSKVMTKTTYWV